MNGELKKAELIELSNDKEPKELGTVNVQFNPNSLKLKLSNKSEGGNSRGRQRRQHTGVSSTTLSMDLVFDSSDEGTSDAPISVRTKTALVEKFVITQKGKSTPPKLRFRWGDLQVDGVVSDLSIDFDHFSAGGIPLRAKASLSLTEQDAKYEFLETGAGSKADNGAPTPTNSSGAATPGSNSPTISDQSAAALSKTKRLPNLRPEWVSRRKPGVGWMSTSVLACRSKPESRSAFRPASASTPASESPSEWKPESTCHWRLRWAWKPAPEFPARSIRARH